MLGDKTLPIYLDYQSGTMCDKRVFAKMAPFFCECFGNPHSNTHSYGFLGKKAAEEARQEIGAAIGADPREIIFTSGATESNNIAIKGGARWQREHTKGKRNHIITCATEHKAVLQTCRALTEEGFELTVLPVEPSGLLSLEKVREALTERTCLVSVMAVNNELGVIQDVASIAQICREHDILYHMDAAQALGRIPLDMGVIDADLMSLSAHKCYGPKGIGALFVRRKPRVVQLKPIIHGGGQEGGIRPGTVPVPLCVGFGEAARLAVAEMEQENARIQELRDYLYSLLTHQLEAVHLNGDLEHRIPGNLNLSFLGVEGEALILGVKDVIAVSSGSACSSSSTEPSHVMRSLSLPDEVINSNLRICIGRFTTRHDVEKAAEAIISAVNRLREMSPIWESYKEEQAEKHSAL